MSTPADRGVLDRTPPPPDRTEAYGPAGHQVYDVYRPDGPARALVVLVHGGFWRAEWDRTHLRPLAAALARERYAVALVEYVRSGMPGGGWPATGQDVATALSAVRERELPRSPAGAPLPVVLVGHSAGGHLAVWVLHQPAAVGAAPAVGVAPAGEPARVVGAVSLAGALDLALVADLGLDDGAAEDLMGVAADEDPAAWAGADPARLGRTPYPVVVVHGDADEQVPLAVARSWWERAGTPGRDRLVVLPGVGHFPLIDPEAPVFGTLLDQIGGLCERG